MTIRCSWLLITSTNSTSAEIGQSVLSGLGPKSQEFGNCTRLIPARSPIAGNDRLICSQIPNSTRSYSADTERDDAGDVRLAIEDDQSRRRDRASALSAAPPVAPDSRRFSCASQAWRPTRAAHLSACPCSVLARNRHSTTTPEKRSMALSPPNASSAGLRARHAAKSDTAASALIQAIVTVCIRWIRRIASGDAVCSTEANHNIMALHSHLRLQWIPSQLALKRIMSSLGRHPRACTCVQQIACGDFLAIGYPLEGHLAER
jgi:hypothetical protein